MRTNIKMNDWRRRIGELGGVKREGLSFIAIGIANTLFTLGLYQTLLFVAPAKASYFLSYAAGVVISYTANRRLTFRREGSPARFAMFIALQIFMVLTGAAVLQFLINAGLSPRLAVFGVIVFLTPLGFVGSKLVFRGARTIGK